MLKSNALHGLLGFLGPTLILMLAYKVLIVNYDLELVGVFLIATALSGSMAFISSAFTHSVVYFVAKSGDDISRALSYTLTSILAFTIFGFLIYLVSYFYIDSMADFLVSESGNISETVAIVASGVFVVPFNFCANSIQSYYKGRQQFKKVSWVKNLLAFVSYLIPLLVGLLFDISMADFSWLYAGSYVAVSLVYLFVFTKENYDFFDKSMISWGVLKKNSVVMFKYGWSMMVTGFLSFIFYQSQRFVIVFFAGAKAAAIYVIAFTLASKVHQLFASTFEAIFPMVVRGLHAKKESKIYIGAYFFIVAMASLVLGVVSILSNEIFPLWLNDAVGVSVAAIFPVVAFGFVFISVSVVPYYFSNGKGRPVFNLLNLLLRVVIYLAVLLMFIGNGLNVLEIAWAFSLAAFLVDGVLWPFFIYRRVIN